MEENRLVVKLSDFHKKKITLMHHIFHVSTEGKELLEMLKKEYLLGNCADPTQPDWHIYLREGENNMIRLFVHSKNLMNKLKETQDGK